MLNSAFNPTIADLRERIQRLEGRAARKGEVLSFGLADIDARLPGGGRTNEGLHVVYGRSDRGGPALIVWPEWWSAHEQVDELCRKQQRLESALIAAFVFPHVDIVLPDQDCVVAAFSVEEMDRRFGDVQEDAEATMRAKAVLAEWQGARDALDERLGFSRAKQAEEEAFAVQTERLDDLFAKPACSVAGVAAKLHALLAMGEDSPGDEFP